jgi:hypothetical protein
MLLLESLHDHRDLTENLTGHWVCVALRKLPQQLAQIPRCGSVG